jgi:arylsulfatase/arylsulfatase A
MSILAPGANPAERPNVLIVITDDQGYGDLGHHGNPILKTPNLDAFARASVQMTHFHVSPVCSPTRSSLMTGRYNYRTGVVDTFIGRSMMHGDEMTIAEVLRANGYRTGQFGKWHLGDCYPLRPQDQGFEEVVMHRGGGIAQPSDPPGGSSYTDPILFHNGEAKKCKGYVTNVVTDAAIDFVSRKSDKSFFAYVAYNCPHSPFQVLDEDWKPYRGIDLGPDAFPKIGSPWSSKKKLKEDDIGKAYGMIANLDANFGRLLEKVPDNTLVIFLTDNGPGGVRWNAGLRNRKGTVYDGGIRVPFFAQWKGKWKEGRKVDLPAAHIDIFPTVLEACGVQAPAKVTIDGRSLLPLMQGEKVDWPDRHLFFQWHRGDVPEMGRACAVRGPRYKLVQAAGVQVGEYTPKYELFDMANDPYEEKDLAAEKPEVVNDLRERYEAWFKDVQSTRNFEGPRIYIGGGHEKKTTLTRQDWRGPKAGWADDNEGHWDIVVQTAGTYRLKVDFIASKEERKLNVQIGGFARLIEVKPDASDAVVDIPVAKVGEVKLEAWLEGAKRIGVKFVEVERVGE